MSKPCGVRLPLEPLLALTAECVTRHQCVNMYGPTERSIDREAPITVLALLAGVSRRAIYRWRAHGGVPIDTAEDAAFALGYHPIHIWGWDTWIGAVLGPNAIEAAA